MCILGRVRGHWWMPGGGGGRQGPSSALAPSASPAPLPPSIVRLWPGRQARAGSEGSRIRAREAATREGGSRSMAPSWARASQGTARGRDSGSTSHPAPCCPSTRRKMLADAQARGRGPHTVLELGPSPPPRPSVCGRSGHSLLRLAPAGRTGVTGQSLRSQGSHGCPSKPGTRMCEGTRCPELGWGSSPPQRAGTTLGQTLSALA